MVNLTLRDKWATKTSTGVISKGIYVDNGKQQYLVKGNSEEGCLEPYSEVLASRIISKLGVDCVKYELGNKEDYKDIKVYGDCNHVSICKRLHIQNIFQFYNFVHRAYLPELDLLKTYKNLGLSMTYFKTMLTMDALIGNKDRHWNNFDIYFDSKGNILNASLLDFGNSLLASVKEKDLKDYTYPRIGPDSCKPLKETHSKQIHYINRIVPDKLNINTIGLEDFMKWFTQSNDDVFQYMTEKRKQAIVQYVEARYTKFILQLVTNGEQEDFKNLDWCGNSN